MNAPLEPEALPEVVMPTCPIRNVLKGQKALVTGANSGIGKGIAIALAHAGADVVVNFVSNAEAAQQVAEEASRGASRVYAHQADISDENQVQAMFKRMIEDFGTIDILVNNAGLQQDAPFEDMTLEQWNKVIGVNLTGQFLCSREAVREFKRRGVRKDVYCATSKGGVMLMMKSIAQEVAPYRIRVNSICPGAIRTPINRQAWETPEAYHELLKLIPYKRIGEVEDIGRVAVFLASDDADYVHGASLFVDGGMTLFLGFAVGG